MKLPIVCLFLGFLTLVTESEGKCENPSTFPVLIPWEEQRYLCSVEYQKFGHPDEFFACNGDSLYLQDDAYESAPGPYYPVGSLVVKAGCTYHGYREHNFQGESHVFKGPVIVTEVPGLVSSEAADFPNGYASYMCECDMNYINCVPEDNYEVVLYCDATGASVDTTCKYQKTIGTSYSSTISDSMSIDSTIESSMKSTFFGLFEASLSVSVHTGYNWGSTSEEAKSEQVTVEVDGIAPAGQRLTIEQAVGHCDSSSVKTELFKITHTSKTGEVIKTEFKHANELV